MNNFDKSMLYISMLNESTAIKKETIPEAISFLTTINDGKVDLSSEVIDGMQKYSDMEAMDKLLLHKSLSSNKEYIKKVVMLHKDKGPDYRYYPYMPDVLNELLKDPKKCKQVATIVSEISSNYRENVNQLEMSKSVFKKEDLLKQIDASFVMSPPYMEYLNSINKVTNEPEVLNEDDNEYVELTESLLVILSEVSVKDKAVNVAVKVEKKAEALANTINRIKEKYEEKAKLDKGEAIVKETWQIKKQLRRIIRSAPVAIINPAVAFLVYLTLTLIDRKIDKRVRAEYVGDLKLEIKLLEDKIAEADSKGDNRAKVKLIREKDKLERALEKLLSGRARA